MTADDRIRYLTAMTIESMQLAGLSEEDSRAIATRAQRMIDILLEEPRLDPPYVHTIPAIFVAAWLLGFELADRQALEAEAAKLSKMAVDLATTTVASRPVMGSA